MKKVMEAESKQSGKNGKYAEKFSFSLKVTRIGHAIDQIGEQIEYLAS